MQLTPEVKAQLAEQKKQCVFCKLISGDMEAKTVFDDSYTIAMLDINPIIKGHTLFMLKEHYPIMPYIPADEFKHFFGLTAGLTKVIKEAMLSTGINVFIANGGPAGQQSPHFLIHFLPRENEDGFFNFLFKEKVPANEEHVKLLGHNFPLMMNNHFQRNPNDWHTGKGNVPAFLTELYENNHVIYEDEKTLCFLPKKGLVEGHIQIYSKLEEKYLEKLSSEDAAHLFYVASFAATAVFEGLGAHGTNIIVKSGESDDNPQGKLSVHVLPRKQDDGLNVNWQPKQPSYDLDAVKDKIKDKTWKIGHKEEKKKEKVEEKPKVIKIDSKETNSNDEIKKAIERMRS